MRSENPDSVTILIPLVYKIKLLFRDNLYILTLKKSSVKLNSGMIIKKKK